MAEFFTSFPSSQIKPVEFKAADLINIGRTGIAYQKENQANQERVALQDFFSNPDNFQTDGRIDMEKINAKVPALAPMTGREVLRNVSDLSTAQTQALAAKQGLTASQRGMVGQVFNILGKAGINDRTSYFNALDDLVASNPDNKDLSKLSDAYKKIWKTMPPDTNWSQLAITGAQTLLPVSEQESKFAPQPGTLGTGAQTLSTVTQPSVGGLPPTQTVGGALARAELPPGSMMEATGTTDLAGNPIANVKDSTGRIVGQVTIPAGVPTAQMPGGQGVPMQGGMATPQPTGTMTYPPRMGAAQALPVVPQQVTMTPLPNVVPGTSQAEPRPDLYQRPPAPTTPMAPQPNVPMAPQANASLPNAPMRLGGESQATFDAAQQLRIQARQNANTVSTQISNNNQIIKLADETLTGRGANFIGALTGGYALLPYTSDNASNLNQLGHYMSLQTAQLAGSSGLGGTDAARSIAGQMAGTTEWTPQAIKATARVNRALATSTELFNQGIENSFQRTRNPFSSTEFQQRWIQTLGPQGIDAMRLYDGLRNNDQEAIREVITQVGGPNSPGYQTLKRKLEDVKRLVEGR
jgi:hypothetical protein